MRALATILVLAATGPALAQDLSYNYLELTYSWTEIDAGFADVDGDGFGFKGSLEVGDMWHIFAGIGQADLDQGVDYDQIVIGGGLHTPIAPNMSLYLDLAYINVDAAGPGGSFDDDGLGTELGLRMWAMPQLEVRGALSYTDLGDSDAQTGIEGAAWYEFSRNFAAGFGIGFTDDTSEYGLGLRYYFE
ncbi:MAG TPA: outer membrane beta-barrel protein [Woeseiaceae bacterium]|nr:outer membrane beta-barrel protein [Woeseiaceae bacterium]